MSSDEKVFRKSSPLLLEIVLPYSIDRVLGSLLMTMEDHAVASNVSSSNIVHIPLLVGHSNCRILIGAMRHYQALRL